MKTSNNTIAKLRLLLAAATPGPWECRGSCIIATVNDTEDQILTAFSLEAGRDADCSNAAITAESRNALLPLLNDLDAARTVIEEVIQAADTRADPDGMIDLPLYNRLRACIFEEMTEFVKEEDQRQIDIDALSDPN